MSSSGALHFGSCVLGIYGSFLAWGWLQERLTTTAYGASDSGGSDGGERFVFISFLNLVQYGFACIVAQAAIGLGIAESKAVSSDRSLHRDVVKVAVTNTLGSLFGYASLGYISFPLHILAKSCKLVPVMVMGFLINGTRYSLTEVASVVCITVGLVIFAAKPGQSDYSTELAGVALVFTNLSLDGITNALQDRINRVHAPTPHDMMCAMSLQSPYSRWMLNMWSVLLLLPCAFYVAPALATSTVGLPTLGSGWSAISFLQRQPRALADMLCFCAAGAVGQNFIFISLSRYGSLINVTITITRKFITIFISNFVFGHNISPMQWGGCCLVFCGLAVKTMAATSSHRYTKKTE